MAISFINGTVRDDSGLSITGTEPTSTAQNDLVIALVQTAENPSTGGWTAPADFTEIDSLAETTGARDQHWYLGYKIRGATAGNGYQWSHGGTSDTKSILLATYRGIDTAAPLDVTWNRTNHYVAYDNAVNTAAKAITTNTNNTYILLLQCVSRTISGAAGQPSGYTERVDGLTAAGSNDGLYLCDKPLASQGTETPGVWTHTDDGLDEADAKNFTLALKSVGGVVPTIVHHRKLLGMQ